MGLGAEHLKAVNPKLIYTSVSGFGQTGPDRRRAGVNLIIEAFSGVLSVTGEPGQMPMRPGVQTADVFGALFATYATLASLVGAARNGEGRIADISLVEASIAAAAWEAAEYLETGKVPQPMGNRHRLTAPYQLFETSDKRYVAIGTPNDMLFQKFMQTIGLEAHLADPRFATYANRKTNEDPLLALVEPAIRKMNSDELEAALMEAGVPCARVNNFKEVFEHPQIVARGVVKEIEHPRLGTMKVTRNPVLLDHDGPDIARPAPMLGEHSEEILRELGYDQAAIETLVSAGVTKLAAAAQPKVTARIAGTFSPCPAAFSTSRPTAKSCLDKAIGLPADACVYDLADSCRRREDQHRAKRPEDRKPTIRPKGGTKPANRKTHPSGDSPKPPGDKLQHAVDEAAERKNKAG